MEHITRAHPDATLIRINRDDATVRPELCHRALSLAGDAAAWIEAIRRRSPIVPVVACR